MPTDTLKVSKPEDWVGAYLVASQGKNFQSSRRAHGVKTTFWTFILSNRSYPSTASDRGMILSNMKLQ